MTLFHGSSQLKRKLVRRMDRHERADRLTQDYLYWSKEDDGTFRGCALGCIVATTKDPSSIDWYDTAHERVAREVGMPIPLANLVEAVFECSGLDYAMKWPGRLLRAMVPGSEVDLDVVEDTYDKAELLAVDADDPVDEAAAWESAGEELLEYLRGLRRVTT